MDAHPGLAPGGSVLQTDGSSLHHVRGKSWVDQRDSHPYGRLHRAGCYSYIMINIGKMVAVSGIAPDSPRLQRGANLSQLHSRGPSARFRAAVVRLSGGCSAIELRRVDESRWRVSRQLL